MKALEALTTFGNLWMGYSTVKETYPKHFKAIEESLKAIEVLQDGFSFSSYNPNGDYFVISFTIKENCDRKLINETLFGGSEVLKCQKE